MNDSNYPPGVSGNEPQITGYDERDATREALCANDECARFDVPQDAEGTEYLLTAAMYGNPAEIEFVWECTCCHQENREQYEVGGDS